MEFNTKYVRPTRSLEKNCGKSVVEHSAHISTEMKIESMLLSGQQLIRSRQEQFDTFDDSFDEDSYDPIRNIGLDMAEVSQMSMAAEEVVRDNILAEQEAKKQELAEARRIIEEANKNENTNPVDSPTN